jgi:hypothetical protein
VPYLTPNALHRIAALSFADLKSVRRRLVRRQRGRPSVDARIERAARELGFEVPDLDDGPPVRSFPPEFSSFPPKVRA